MKSRTNGVSFLIGGNGAGTTETCCHKIARFVLSQQPPPRKDTPFWVIAGSYEQVCETAWKEKLEGHGHIPGCEIDYERVSWINARKGWPSTVPLKPWPGRPDKNWVLEFKSYEQGRQQMQARSIGGFCFIEQFPWELLTEVLRGCREYNFGGSMFCEFTPIDPMLSYPLERMQEEDRLPPGWEVWRANTECAVEAGHVSKEWFEQFMASIPEMMRSTRTIGAWAVYEGAIFQTFNDRMHVIEDDYEFGEIPDDRKVVVMPGGTFPLGVFHRRGIDWGSGPANAFAVPFVYRNGKGQWFVYDEYYSVAPITTADHLVKVIDRERMWGWRKNDPHYGTTWADPSSPGDFRVAEKLGQYVPGYEGFGISAASNRVLEGIQHVQWLLQPAAELDGQPRLFISKRCKNLIRQMRSYRWKKGTDHADPRREPEKKDDHCIDALRYVVFSEASLGDITPTSIAREHSSERHGVQLRGADATRFGVQVARK